MCDVDVDGGDDDDADDAGDADVKDGDDVLRWMMMMVVVVDDDGDGGDDGVDVYDDVHVDVHYCLYDYDDVMMAIQLNGDDDVENDGVAFGVDVSNAHVL